MLFTGLRRKSASEIRWADVDLEAATLHIPNPKGGEERAFTLPLPMYLVGLLKSRRAEHAKFCGSAEKALPWVFPSPEAESGHVQEIREDDLGVTPHDARRLFITVAESLDVSSFALKLLANHALPRDVTAGYIRPDTERLRPVVEQVASKMRSLCEPRPAKVLPMRGRKKRA
jgi:integrase